MELHDLYAATVECSDAAIVAKDVRGIVLIWNAAAERLMGYSAEEMKGRSIRALLPSDRLEEDESILTRIRSGERIVPFLTKRRHKSGHLVNLAIGASPLLGEGGEIVGVSYIARDSSAYVEQQRLLRESEERFRMLADNIAQFAWIARPDGRIIWFNKRSYAFTGLTPGEMVGWGFIDTHHPDEVDRVTTGYRQCVAEGRDWEDTFRLRGADGRYRWFLTRASPARNEAGEIVWWIGTNIDITEERERSEQIRLLLMEVNHRSKNLLSTVQALARRSAQGHPDFVARFEERVRSLAINQDILVRREWREVPLSELAREQLAFVEGAPGDLTAQGIECSLVPRAAEVVGMALHELATNSLKYGALSAKGGHVEIGWDCAPDCTLFEIWWRESDGPPVVEPSRQGFGTTLIRDVPRHNLGAEVTLDYKPQGLNWLLRADERVLVTPICPMGD